VGVRVGVRVCVGVGRGVGVTTRRGVRRGLVERTVGVGCFRWGVTVRIKLKAMLNTTSKLSVPKMIRCPLPCERFIFNPSENMVNKATSASLTR
jgi:hypothetical protein